MYASGIFAGRLIVALLLLIAAHFMYQIFVNPDTYQWDFKMYYYAARVDASGGNPYNPNELHRLAGGGLLLRYVYPPPILTFFKLFAAMPYPVAYHLWLAFKLLLLGGLLILWRRFFFPAESLVPYATFLLLAFSTAIYIDLVTGNISILEQFLLWLGFVFLLREKPRGFCMLVLLGSCFKVFPIAFLLLLPLLGVKHSWRYVFASAAVFAGVFALSYFLDPAGYERFFAAATAIDERGAMGNISLLACVKDVSDLVFNPQFLGGRLPYVIYVVAVAAIIFLSLKRMHALRRMAPDDAGLLILFLFCVAFALVMPRFKTYSCILLLAPGYWVVKRSSNMPAFVFLLALFVLDVQRPSPVKLPLAPLLSMFWTYYPLFLAFLVWGMLLYHSREPSASATAQVAT